MTSRFLNTPYFIFPWPPFAIDFISLISFSLILLTFKFVNNSHNVAILLLSLMEEEAKVQTFKNSIILRNIL